MTTQLSYRATLATWWVSKGHASPLAVDIEVLLSYDIPFEKLCAVMEATRPVPYSLRYFFPICEELQSNEHKRSTSPPRGTASLRQLLFEAGYFRK